VCGDILKARRAVSENSCVSNFFKSLYKRSYYRIWFIFDRHIPNKSVFSFFLAFAAAHRAAAQLLLSASGSNRSTSPVRRAHSSKLRQQ